MRRLAPGQVALVTALLFALLSAMSLHRVPPTAETTLWAATDQRTILEVGGNPQGTPVAVLAGPLSEEAEASLNASLTPGWTERRLGPLGLVHSNQRYRSELLLGSWRIPWLVNDYTAAFPDWLPLLLYRATGSMRAGLASTVLLAALLAGLAAGWTCRRRGPIAGLLVGAILATDLWFHVYKKLLGSTDLWLQALTVLIVMLLVDWSETRSERKLLLAAGLAGLGLSVKLTFGVVLLAIGLTGLAAWPRLRPAPSAPRTSWARRWGLPLLAIVLGTAPLWATHLHRQANVDPSFEENGHDTFEGRIREFRAHRERTDPAPQKQLLLSDFFLHPAAYWSGLLSLRRQATGSPLEPERLRPGAVPPRRQAVRSPTELASHVGWTAPAHQLGYLALVLLALLGSWRQRGLEAWLLLAGASTVLLVRQLHADTHHLAIATPLLALGLGTGAAAGLELLRERHRGLILGAVALLTLGGLARVAELRGFDETLTTQGGGLADKRNLQELAATLVVEDVRSPAVLSYELVALLDGLSGGELQPWLWWKTNLRLPPSDPLANGSPGWLQLVLRSHAGGHLLIASTPPGGPGSPAGAHWFDAEAVEAAGAAVGLEPRVLRDLHDPQGRWYASIWTLPRAEPAAGQRR